MDFFGIGWGELFLILVIMLIVFGPGRLPEVARALGKTVRVFRQYTTGLTRDFREEFDREVRGEPPATENKSDGNNDKPA